MTSLDPGLARAARYSIPPNCLGYCGPKDGYKILEDYLEGGASDAQARETLEGFEGLHPYLKLISKKSGLAPLSEKVVSAYWLGNELLEKVSSSDLESLILDDFSKYLTPSVAKELAAGVPDGALAHHSFHVLHVLNVSSLTGRVPLDEKTPDNCLVSAGLVKELKGDEAVVEVDYVLKEPSTRTVTLGEGSPGSVEVGDTAAVHWNSVVEKLSEVEAKNLKHYTRLNADLLRSSKA